MDSKKVIILDIRVPTIPVAELCGHSAPINHVTWAPHSAHHLASVGDDAQALIWDYCNGNMSNNNNNNNGFGSDGNINLGFGGVPSNTAGSAALEPFLSYSADAEINSVAWSKTHPEFMSITFEDKLQMLHL